VYLYVFADLTKKSINTCTCNLNNDVIISIFDIISGFEKVIYTTQMSFVFLLSLIVGFK